MTIQTKAVASHLLINPESLTNKTWKGTIHSCGQTGGNHFVEASCVYYDDDDKIEVNINNTILHAILYHKIVAIDVEVTEDKPDQPIDFNGMEIF